MSYNSIKSMLPVATSRHIDEQNKELRLPLAKIARLFLSSPNYLKTRGIMMHVPSFGSLVDVGQSILDLLNVVDPVHPYTVALDDMQEKRRSLFVTLDREVHTVHIKRQHERACRVSRLGPHTVDDIQAIFMQLVPNMGQHARFMHVVLEELTHKGAFSNKQGGYDMEGICRLSHMYGEDMHMYGSEYDPRTTIKRYMQKK